MAMQTVVVVNQGTIFKARPSFLATKPGEQVKFSNWCGQTVTLNFSSGLFDKDQLILSTGTKDTLTARDVADGRYTYTGAVAGGGDVLGESNPEIIIDR